MQEQPHGRFELACYATMRPQHMHGGFEVTELLQFSMHFILLIAPR